MRLFVYRVIILCLLFVYPSESFCADRNDSVCCVYLEEGTRFITKLSIVGLNLAVGIMDLAEKETQCIQASKIIGGCSTDTSIMSGVALVLVAADTYIDWQKSNKFQTTVKQIKEIWDRLTNQEKINHKKKLSCWEKIVAGFWGKEEPNQPQGRKYLRRTMKILTGALTAGTFVTSIVAYCADNEETLTESLSAGKYLALSGGIAKTLEWGSDYFYYNHTRLKEFKEKLPTLDKVKE